jgi:glycosyltransferase involved in cell wall biosynthesis
MADPELSIVIPVKNEEECIPVLAAEIESALTRAGIDWECLWINDGSTDRTPDVLDTLARREPRHRRIDHTQSFGQSAGLATGFRRARGPVIGTLDGDGQNDPADLPAMYRRLVGEKQDMVTGWRQKRNDTVVRKISSRIANTYRNWLTGEQIRDVGCAIRVFRRDAALKVPVFKGMHRYFPTLFRIAGHSAIVEVPVHHRPREKGVTKYGIHNRLWVGLVDTLMVVWMRRRLVFPRTRD